MLLVDGALAAFNGMLVATRKFWCECVLGGVCCEGECHCESGRCCGDVWHPDDDPDPPCGEGRRFFEWGVNDQCCGCLPEQIFDHRVQEFVNTADLLEDFCCPVCDALVSLLPFGLSGEFIGCKGRCCDGIECSETLEADCAHEWSAGHCCEEGCPKSCCTENADGTAVACQTTEQNACAGTLDDEPCETACKGACCYYDEEGNYVTVDGSPMTKAACEAAGGEFQGIGTTECRMCEEPGFGGNFRCRSPLTACCCEEKSSTGAGLTFTQPRNKRLPPISDTVQVTVTVSTISDILVHGEYITGGPYGKCNETITFLMCWDSFNVEPVPCGSNFAGLNIKVCWDQWATDVETLKFSGCDDITVWLGNCEYECVTTLLYTGLGDTSNATIVMRGDAVIDSSGIGPLVLTTPITHAGDCARTLTLTGTNGGENEIAGAIGDRSLSHWTTVVKRGAGLWVLSGANTFSQPLHVKQGTLVAGRDALGSSGAFGAAGVQQVLVGDTTPNAAGTARLLIDADFSTDKTIVVQTSASTQPVVVGGRGAGTVDFQNELWIGRAVTLVADNQCVTFFSAPLKNAIGNDDPTFDITFGIPGYTGEVRMLRKMTTSGTVSFLHGTATFTDIKTNPDQLVVSATFTNTTLTVHFSGTPAPESQYVIFGGATQQAYTPTLIGTIVKAKYVSEISTLIISSAPTDITLSANTVAENRPVGTTVGTLTTTDADLNDPAFNDSHTYTIVSGDGFQIVGNALKTAKVFDYEQEPSASVTIRTTDTSGFYFEKTFTIQITNVNEAPTDITLSANTVAENQPVGTTVGTLTTTDPDANDSHTYTIVSGSGFQISGNALKTAVVFDYEQGTSAGVTIRSTDSGGLSFVKSFTIQITNTSD